MADARLDTERPDETESYGNQEVLAMVANHDGHGDSNMQDNYQESSSDSDSGSGQSDPDDDEPSTLREHEDLAQMRQIQTDAAAIAGMLATDESPTVPDADDDSEIAETTCPIRHVRFVQELIQKISLATLENDKLDPDMLDNLKHPDTEPIDISDPDTRLSLDLFTSCNNASEATYNAVRDSVLRRFPNITILSYHPIKKFVSKTTVVDAVLDEMRIKSCVAFVGPFADLKACPECSEPRYDPEKLAQSGK
ncbi:hypothetical protein K443DRAFT_15215 [Laccaria amethystina LaAM-08-1]|uniref:Uncharacterized protein n=1 Tax=Laccaria amethystina LaAM-08-1 TaxID=1095629 RepID=A0A0C9X1P3_9AGAR|nr:hypothetical protein K443DRAFT_15215 [Laccaria amethystina LaAM-08-1]